MRGGREERHPSVAPAARRPLSVAATAGVRMGEAPRGGRTRPWCARCLAADGDARPARPWRGCAGRHLRVRG
jgi:hypothetical protein